MNQALQDLKARALVSVFREGYNEWHVDETKFAELIIRECINCSYLEDSGNPEVEEALEFWRGHIRHRFNILT